MLLILGAARRVSEGIEKVKYLVLKVNRKWKWSADFLIGKQLTGAKTWNFG